jgi:hypothetical protein
VDITKGLIADTGLLGSLQVEVIDLDADDDVIPQTPTGIIAQAVGDTSTLYVFQASIPYTQNYAIVWWLGTDIVEADIGVPPQSGVFVPVVTQPVGAGGVSLPGTWYYKRGDDRIPLVGQFVWNGLTQNISTVAQLLFKMRLAAPAGPDFTVPLKVNSLATPIPMPPDPTNPTAVDDGSWFSYQPAITDFDTVGQYDAEIEATWADGTVLTAPTTTDPASEYYRVVVIEDTDGA